MQKFEDIIQQTFSKINASDPKLRQKVYENIWFLQEKALAEQNIDAGVRQERRAALTQLLKRVEMRYRAQYDAPASAPAPIPAPRKAPQYSSETQWGRQERNSANRLPPEMEIPSPAPAADPRANNYIQPEPELSPQPQSARERRDSPALDPVADTPRRPVRTEDYAEHHSLIDKFKVKWADRQAAKQARRKACKDRKELVAEPDDNLDPEYAEDGAPIPVPQRKSHWGAYIFTIAFILVACFTAWTFYASFGSPESKRARQALMTAPLKQNAYDKNGWTEIFNPLTASGIKTAGGAAAELHKEPDANFIRVTTRQSDDAAILTVSGNALQNLRGKTAVLKLLARSADDQIGPLRMTADFGNGERQIYKFELSPTEKPLLFSLDIPQSVTDGAKFYISNEAPAGMHEIDIYAILSRGAAGDSRP